jgi:hypothetical protein
MLAGAGCAGVLLRPRAIEDVQVFARDVAPGLQVAGLLRKAYPSGDFRSRLGLRRPTNRFTGDAELASAPS